jgi:hypothetical protein
VNDPKPQEIVSIVKARKSENKKEEKKQPQLSEEKVQA